MKNLRRLGHRVSGCEKNPLRLKQINKKYNIEMFSNLRDALAGKYDGAFVCTPTNLHVPMSIEIAKRGMHLFIEKPLSNSIRGITELSAIVKKKKLVVLVGCNMRFMPGLKFVKNLIEGGRIGKVVSVRIECGFYLPYWPSDEDYRKRYSAKRRLGGGVIFDDIHEIDSLYWLFGKVNEVFCFTGKLGNLEINTEDIAEIFLRFKSKMIAQIHLDYLQRTYRRSYEFIGEEGIIYFDIMKQRIEWYKKRQGQCKVLKHSIGANFDRMFIDEVKHFINCIKGRERSINDIPTSRKVLETAFACHKSAEKKEIIHL
jgi:predicted dehydrogenase